MKFDIGQEVITKNTTSGVLKRGVVVEVKPRFDYIIELEDGRQVYFNDAEVLLKEIE